MNTFEDMPHGKKYFVLGIMSGTSLDGVDLAVCSFEQKHRFNYQIHHAITTPYTDEWTHKLQTAHLLNAHDFAVLNVEYGHFLGKLCKAFIKGTGTSIDFISSHGHTIFHQPALGISTQLGSGAAIAASSCIDTVCDFRSTDIALGGQGAPLVPVGDALLFNEFSHCLNLGGIANISYTQNQERIAYDICPANMILNYLSQKTGNMFDNEGKLAGSGVLLPDLLQKLENLDFYHTSPPKSLGREWVWSTSIPLLEHDPNTVIDKLTTCTYHIVSQISRHITPDDATVLVSGGGAHNVFLTNLLSEQIAGKLYIPEKTLIEFKEALVFAFLGLLRLLGKANTLSSVTGASRNSSSGCIYLAK
jgi:anhydro-N-acetylmuramic acid kinase